ncbi:MAG: hypothetical protein ACFFD4_17775 [Candidatus Odinarchaeota archaeon]
MNFIHSSVIKGVFLALVVIAAGVSLGFLIFPGNSDEWHYPPADLLAWSSDDTIIFPSYTITSVHAFTNSTGVLHHQYQLYDNVTQIELYNNISTANGLTYDLYLHRVSIDSVFKVVSDSDWWYSSRASSGPAHPTLKISQLSIAFKDSVRDVISSSSDLSYSEYLELGLKLKPFYHDFSDDTLMVRTAFFGTDGIVIFLDIYPTGIVVYGSYYESKFIIGHVSLEDYIGDGEYVHFNVKASRFFFLPVASYEDALHTSYLAAWNTTLHAING